MKQYQFDFSTMTIGDCTAFADAVQCEDLHRAALIMDKFVVGGFMNLSLLEMTNAVTQYVAAFDDWYNSRNVDEGNITRLLKQALGDGDK
jgi:hypothetical protein